MNLNSRVDMTFASSRMANPQLAEPPQVRNMLRTESEGLTRRVGRSRAQQSVKANSVVTESQETLKRLVDNADKLLPATLSGSVSGWLEGLSATGFWYDLFEIQGDAFGKPFCSTLPDAKVMWKARV
jgi:hypothetical protein